ncbi:MAG: carotenoid biosynthesis protein, partial [Candidatus Poribacteria bacterium]
MPYIDQNYTEESFALSITFSVILQALAVLSILINTVGLRRTVFISIGVIFITLLIESIGVATGFPFGKYNYTEKLQPQLLNVPLLIPLAWLMMLPSSWAIAQKITGQHKGIKFVIVSSLAFTVWDLVLDPQMVEWGVWIWHNPSGYFGIPFTNFLGWFLSAMIVTLLIKPPKLDDKY